jgi:hypothetical protein
METINPPILSIAVGTPQEFNCGISIDNFTGDTVAVSYQGLPASQPKTFGCFVAIWQASMIPWNEPPLKQVTIDDNGEQGSYVLDGLTIGRNSYIVGFGTGPDITDICASSMLKAGGLLAAPTYVSIGLDYIGSNALAIHYQTLAGYLPQQSNNWIGLWPGYASPYTAGKPAAQIPVSSNNSEGVVAMNNVALGINSNYTLIYFMGGSKTTAAAMLNFSTGS